MSGRRRRWLLPSLIVVVAALIGGFFWLNDSSSSPKMEAPKAVLEVLGDSYASGEGLSPYEPATDIKTDKCHRSLNDSFATLAAEQLDMTPKNVSCSGAAIKELLAGIDSEPSQVSQIDSDAQTVVVEIGGNDVEALAYLLNTPSVASTQAKLAELQPKLADAYKQIKTKVPNARIYAIGYPSIVPAASNNDCPFTNAQLGVLNQGAALLNETIAHAATTAGIKSVDVTRTFAGHELCSTAPWVNGLDFSNLSGSLHPNADGQRALAAVLVQALKNER